jgi:endonuclease/exonuclease/phosphatase family metal-dependent hydrolase
MFSFPKPSFTYNYQVDIEINNLKNYKNTASGRAIPAKSSSHLLIATWNIANLGLQDRNDKDYQLIAEMISWFDMVALQEVYDNLIGLRSITKNLPSSFKVIFSDKAGNNERSAFLYDTTSNKVNLLEKFGEIAVPPKDHKYINLPNVQQKFTGFDRNPFLVSFKAGDLRFLLVNVHLFYGKDSKKDRERRALEAYATSRWADLRQRSKNAYVRDIIVLGDFNLPKVEPGDLIYSALRRRGLRRPLHSTRIYSNLSNDKEYDQIMFFPGHTKQDFTGKMRIFDFDGALFPDLWQTRTAKQFRSFLRYYISDHRILWAEFKI